MAAPTSECQAANDDGNCRETERGNRRATSAYDEVWNENPPHSGRALCQRSEAYGEQNLTEIDIPPPIDGFYSYCGAPAAEGAIMRGLEQLDQTDTLERGMILYDIARKALTERSSITGEKTDHDSIVRECNRIMVLNGYPDAGLENKSNITMSDLPRAWNGVRWDQEFRLYDDAALSEFADMAAARRTDGVENARRDNPPEAEGQQNGSDESSTESEPEQQQSADTSVYWDPELYAVNTSLQPAQGLQPGQKYWKLVSADYLPPGEGEGQSGGRHHIYYQVLDENGQALPDKQVTMAWPDGQSSDVTKAADSYLANQPMYASFAPDRAESGPYWAFVSADGLPSDTVQGLGLPLNQHASYRLTYQLSTWGAATANVRDTNAVPEPQGEQHSNTGDGLMHMSTVDGFQSDRHPDLNLDLRGFAAVHGLGLPVYNSDTGPVDQGAPQLASLFGADHPVDGEHLPPVRQLYRVNDWNWDESIPRSESKGRRGAPITNTEVTMLGFETTAGEPLYLPNSEYRVDGNGNQGQILYLDRSKGEITIAYNLSGTVAGGYTVHLRGVDLDSSLSEGALVSSNFPLGSARGNEVLVAMTDRGTFMDIRHTNHWWQRRNRHGE